MSDVDDLWNKMEHVLHGNNAFVLATVISTSSSAPRPAGTQMAILHNGTVVGSLSGGCIEGDVLALAEQVAETGISHVQEYGYSDGSALTVGLTCGGTITVYLEKVLPQDFHLLQALSKDIAAGTPVALISAIDGPQAGTRSAIDQSLQIRRDLTGNCKITTDLEEQASLLLQGHESRLVSAQDEQNPSQRSRYFVRSFGSASHMIIFGSNAFAAALSKAAKFAGYDVTVCDARATFLTPERFPEADELVVSWPHEYLAKTEVTTTTVLCVLTHDPKFDDPLLKIALTSKAAFIGAMGSRRTTRERFERLRATGFNETTMNRLHAPFGLDLGASTPEETAISMLAEIIAKREGRDSQPLKSSQGPIHRVDRSSIAVLT